jgi:hypothetical protein
MRSEVKAMKHSKQLTPVQRLASYKKLEILSRIHDFHMQNPKCTLKQVEAFTDASKHQVEEYRTIRKECNELISAVVDVRYI